MDSECGQGPGGALFDLDGTITQTAPLRKAAWKSVLDPILADNARRLGRRARPYDIRKDYRDYFDGRHRPRAVIEFLRARGIERPLGSPEDSPEAETGFGLSARKERLLADTIEQRDLEIFESGIALVKKLAADIPVAVVSPSRDVESLLERVGIRDRVQVVVDGDDMKEEGLSGKPAPDLWLAAAKRLGQEPAACLVLDWATGGIEAARRGGFGLAVGVDRGGSWVPLRQAGADRVVEDLAELDAGHLRRWWRGRASVPPAAVLSWPAIREALAGRGLAVVIDAESSWIRPVLERPGQSKASEKVRQGLQTLASEGTLLLVGERRAERLTELAEVEGALIVGSGGLEVWSEGAPFLELDELSTLLGPCAEVVRHLRERCSEDENLAIEHRGASVLVEYRYPQQRAELESALGELELHRRVEHELAFELWPSAVPDRGSTLGQIAGQLDFEGAAASFVVVAGQPEAELAFTTLPGETIACAVLEEPRPTSAQYSIQGEVEIQKICQLLASALRGTPAR